MPLRFVPMQPGVRKVYERSLLDLLPGYEIKGEPVHMRVYVLSLGQVAAGMELAEAGQSGCRVFSLDRGGSVSSCEMTDPGLYGSAAFRNLVQGDDAKQFLDRLQAVQLTEPIRSQDFEVRLLTVSGLFLEAIWLAPDETAVNDVIIPVLTFYEEMTAKSAYAAEEFLALIKPLAEERLAVRPARGNTSDSQLLTS